MLLVCLQIGWCSVWLRFASIWRSFVVFRQGINFKQNANKRAGDYLDAAMSSPLVCTD